MHIGILSQWYDPEPGPAALPGALARSLVARGHEVTVLTGFPNYPTGRIYPGYRQSWRHEEHDSGVRIRRVPLFPSHNTSAFGRISNYASFGAAAAAGGMDALEGLDALWVSNSPPTVALPMWRAIRRTGVPVMLHILDLWPDNVVSSALVDSKIAVRGIVNGIHWWNGRMYSSAGHIAGISPGIVETLVARGVPREKTSFVPMWADEDHFYPGAPPDARKQRGVADDRVVVLYAGTIGRAQAIDSLVKAAEFYPESAPVIEVWIAGSGVEEDEIRALAGRSERSNMKFSFLGRVAPADMASVMASADLHFVGLRDDENSRVTMPSKLQATLATGRPILIAVGGDAESIVLSANAGMSANAGDPATIASALESAARAGRDQLATLGVNARSAYDRDFSLRVGTDRVESVLAGLVKDRST